MAKLTVNNRSVSLGSFASIEDAVRAREAAKVRYWENKEAVIPKTYSEIRLSKKQLSTNTSGYTGVFKYKTRWRAFIRVDGNRIHLGSFGTIEEAAAARKDAEQRLW